MRAIVIVGSFLLGAALLIITVVKVVIQGNPLTQTYLILGLVGLVLILVSMGSVVISRN